MNRPYVYDFINQPGNFEFLPIDLELKNILYNSWNRHRENPDEIKNLYCQAVVKYINKNGWSKFIVSQVV